MQWLPSALLSSLLLSAPRLSTESNPPEEPPTPLQQRFAIRQAVGEVFPFEVPVTIVTDSTQQEFRVFAVYWHVPAESLLVVDAGHLVNLRSSAIDRFKKSTLDFAWVIHTTGVQITFPRLRLQFLYPVGQTDVLTLYEAFIPAAAVNDSLASLQTVAAAESVVINGLDLQLRINPWERSAPTRQGRDH